MSSSLTDPRATSTAAAFVPRNRLLAALPPAELAIIEPLLEPVQFARRRLLYDPEQPIEHVWFPEHGIISIVSVLGDGSAVETATIGREGMIGMAIFHGVDRVPEQAMVQAPGAGFRVSAAGFTTALAQMPTLSALLHRFSLFMFTFAAQSSACNRKHSVEQRCSRWLLTVHDRVDGDDLALTHDFISQMLGVRRASVTDALAILERRGHVITGRTRITVVDRAGLESAVCECYRIVASTYDRLLGNGRIASPLAGVETSRDGYSTVGDGTPIARSTDETTNEEPAGERPA